MDGTVAVFITVGTPCTGVGEADVRDVFTAAEQIGPGMRGDTVIVTSARYRRFDAA